MGPACWSSSCMNTKYVPSHVLLPIKSIDPGAKAFVKTGPEYGPFGMPELTVLSSSSLARQSSLSSHACAAAQCVWLLKLMWTLTGTVLAARGRRGALAVTRVGVGRHGSSMG